MKFYKLFVNFIDAQTYYGKVCIASGSTHNVSNDCAVLVAIRLQTLKLCAYRVVYAHALRTDQTRNSIVSGRNETQQLRQALYWAA